MIETHDTISSFHIYLEFNIIYIMISLLVHRMLGFSRQALLNTKSQRIEKAVQQSHTRFTRT